MGVRSGGCWWIQLCMLMAGNTVATQTFAARFPNETAAVLAQLGLAARRRAGELMDEMGLGFGAGFPEAGRGS